MTITNTSKTTVLADVRRVAKRVRGVPTRSQYRQFGRFSSSLVESRFGSWTRATAKI